MMSIIERLSQNGGGIQTPNRATVHVMGEWIRDKHGNIYSAEEWLNKIGLSSHILVTASPAGIAIRMRRDEQIAYHVKNDNTGNLGIEFLCPGIHNLASLKEATISDYLETAQYHTGVEIVRDWTRAYGFNRDDVKRHSDRDPVDRGFDPGDGFPWLIFIEDVFS